ncbi:UGSC family (seleno)protein [Solwaraspora sp. WMMD1047]|uniref:UGSC family (seleno)protein n=1 Tax=Solwaraspora sp. WMMD1047 TaxID=3016102 RepID=UPI002416F125|nr:UGSC family (seleno)protein [Solwaraspora sp. WMMD1047]MDG4834410.1 UGSC family (seleno)protein [Solwaraspora sp. WMMD1047]
MTELKVLRPDAVLVAEKSTLVAAPRHELAGARLTIIDNGKPRARELLGGIAAQLVERYGLRSYTVFSKPSASKVITDDEAAAIAASCEVVLTGLGDCAGCSACSLQDALLMERTGRPATVVISEPFTGLIASFAGKLGATGYPVTVVPHPVSSRSEAELAGVAARVAERVAGQLSQLSPA